MLNQLKMAKFFDIISYVFLLLNIIAVPLFVDKSLGNPYIIPKQYVFGGLVLINILFWITKFVVTKQFEFRKTIIDKLLVIISVSGLLSAVFSVNVFDSFFGRSEYFSLNFVLLGLFVVYYYLLIHFLKSQKLWRFALDIFLTVGMVSLVLFILQGMFKMNFLNSFSFLATNSIDKINSMFGLWAIVLFILSFGQLVKKDLSLSRIFFSTIIGILALAVLLMLSFKILWFILMFSIILLLVLGLSYIKEVRLGWLSMLFAILVASAVLVFFGTPKFLQMSVPAEVALGLKPSWSVTYSTLFSGVKEFFLGSGLGSFGVDFSKFRDLSFNSDPNAWSMRFSQPFSSVFALLSEGGTLLMVSFIFLFLLLLGHIIQVRNKIKLTSLPPDFSRNSILFETFLCSIVFIVISLAGFSVFYSHVMWWVWWTFLAFIITGFSFYYEDFIKEKKWALENTPQYSLAFSFGLIVAITSVVMVIIFGEKIYFAEKAYAKASTTSDPKKAEVFINQAVSMRSNSDVYRAALAQIYLNQAVALSKTKNPDVQAISALMAKAVNEAKYATDLSPESVVLWENLATMYENAAALVPEARTWALKSLDQAKVLEPTNPTHWWRLGNNYTALAKWDDAILNYQKAIDLKADYFGAYVGLSNVYEQTQKNDKAIEIYEKMIDQNQTNSEILYNYGRLLYNRNKKGDRDKAEKIWIQVVEVQSNYSNALYSLGLLYENKNARQTALEYYYKVKALNPNNKSIIDKINSLVGSTPVPDNN